ncbi:MAG: 3'(2'),5'-bisphosphate nucleotidase CysQ [Desulfobacterales bacterium]|jgi:3'(2'), 5'-bisphosphate nucleotidase
MFDLQRYLAGAIFASMKAGKATLEVYYTDFSVEHKADNTPLTLADRKSHHIIKACLKQFGIPILSEEGREVLYAQRRDWGLLWIVDPLDGTKEFVNCREEFTVNIALVKDGKPVVGVVFVPIKNSLYFAGQGRGSYKLENAQIDDVFSNSIDAETSMHNVIELSDGLPLRSVSDTPFTIVGSRSHGGRELEAFVEQKRKEYDEVEFISAGSSLKFCYVAEGRADIYPRFGPTSEWDTAAGQAIVENAGGEVLDYNTGQPLVYNKQNILNPWFIAKR